LLAFPGVSRVFPADAALGLSLRIIGEINTAVNRILGQGPSAKRYILTNQGPETVSLCSLVPLNGDRLRILDSQNGTILKNLNNSRATIQSCSSSHLQIASRALISVAGSSYMPRKLLRIVATLVLLLVTNLAFAQHHNSNSSSSSQLDQYVEHVSELSSRARANVYFANPQSLFRGVQVNFVNVGTGNLTFLRRDLVVAGRIPLVFARVYDSSGKGSIDLGPGWTLSAAESITVADGKAHLLSENGSTIDFVKVNDGGFRLEKDYPSDYLGLQLVDSTTLQAKLRTGFTKQFQLIGDTFRLVKVTDRNGNEVHLSYLNGLLNKIENANHSITLVRNTKGRVLSAQDDQNRQAQFAYDAQGRLIEVNDLGGNAWTYRYNVDGKLKAAKDPLQRLNFGVFFNDDGRVRRLQLPSGIIQFNYDDATRSTTVLDRKALVSRFFQNEDGITTRVVNPLGEETSIVLDDSRNVLSLSRNGSVIEWMEYDQQHRITARHSTLESGTVDRTYSYDPATGQLAGIHSSNGQDESFSYDGSGNLTSAGLPDGVHKFGRSASGDLASFSTASTSLVFSFDADGLIAGVKEGNNASTTMKYKAGGQLDSVVFADGKSAKYEFQPSGLRANLTYKDKRKAEYTYDPAGNLTSTKVFDTKGKQTAGQVLTLNESYQLIQQTTFAGKIVKFGYDKNGNLTEIREGKSLARFEYDSLNRLVAVITPGGERLGHDYKTGGQSLVEGYQHAKALVLDRRDTGLTFGSPADIFASRPLTGSLGALRFSETLGTFQLSNSEGDEIVTPELAIEQPLEKLNFTFDGIPLQQRQALFNRPFNPMFIPAEYASINCCPVCTIHPPYCPECDPPPPPPASVTISCDTTNLGFGPDPNFAQFAENGICRTEVGNPGGTYTFSASKTTISVTNNNDGTANYTSSSSNPSTAQQDTSITVTYDDPAAGVSVSATFPGITVHKPTSLSTNSTTVNDHVVPCNLACLTNPNSGSCNVTTGTSCTYQEPVTRRMYSIVDQFGNKFENLGLSSAGTVTESVVAQQGSCGGNLVSTGTTGGSPFHDDFGKCDSCCEPGGPGCQSTAQQTIFVNGFSVRSESITVTCQQAALVP
jgi:YD repeat-containing protein